MIMIVVILWTKTSSLYRHRRGLWLHRVSYREGDLHIRIAKLAFHAKESPIRTRGEVFNLVSSLSNSLAKVYSPAVQGPPNPGLPHPPCQQRGRGHRWLSRGPTLSAMRGRISPAPPRRRPPTTRQRTSPAPPRPSPAANEAAPHRKRGRVEHGRSRHSGPSKATAATLRLKPS